MPYLERATRAGPKPSVDDSDCLFGHRTGSCRFAASCEKFVRVPKKTGALRGGYGLTPFTGSATVPVPLNEVQQGPARRLAEAMRDQLVKSDIPAANGPKGLEGLASVAMLTSHSFPPLILSWRVWITLPMPRWPRVRRVDGNTPRCSCEGHRVLPGQDAKVDLNRRHF